MSKYAMVSKARLPSLLIHSSSRKSWLNDVMHVAAAVLNRQDILLSWNFKHLVNRRRRARINDINIMLGFPTLEILAPPEV